MKTVFKSDEIAHVWAHESAPRGKSPGNASFDGDAFYSYATVIARRIRYKGKTAYILDRASFSVSTSKIQGRVACALPSCEKTFSVWNGKRFQSLDWTPQGLRDHYLEESKKAELVPASRYAHKRAEQYRRVTSLLTDAREVCEFFGLAFLAISQKIDKRNAQNEQAADIIKQASEKREAAKLAREKAEHKERLAKNIAYAEAYIANPKGEPIYDAETRRIPEGFPAELLAKFTTKVKENNAAAFDRWRAGEDVRLPYECPVMLRVENYCDDDGQAKNIPEMVTSKGARVPLGEAKRAFAFVVKCGRGGWHRNGETFAIGSYQLDAVNGEGVVAGCHRVSWNELTLFGKAMGWMDENNQLKA